MSELAFDQTGTQFDLPPLATRWRVQRMTKGGVPVIVRGEDGAPLVVPITASFDEVRRAIGTPGRYRLQAIDANGVAVPDLPLAPFVVYAAPTAARDAAKEDSLRELLVEMMRLNTELAKLFVERSLQLLDKIASLLHVPDTLAPLRRIVARAVAMQERTFQRDERLIPANARDVVPPIAQEALEHFVAIQRAMTASEAELARDLAQQLGAAELRAWMDELASLTIPQAVHKVRVMIAGNTEALS